LLSQIPGGAELIAWFGCEPGFHDAEIISLSLDRSAASALRLHAWNMTCEVDGGGDCLLDKHAVVTFQIEDIIELQLDGFSAQNVIYGLKLRRARDCPEVRASCAAPALADAIEIELAPCYGLSGRIRCRRVSVAFTPGKP
jgi:hypothetical protein